MKQVLILALSYLIGSISGSYILGKVFLNIDVRKQGSRNAGTTNALRVLGLRWGILTFFIDFFKGLTAIYLMTNIFDLSQELIFLSSLFCVLGHDYPFYMKLKGGKGVATSLGCFIFINPKTTIIIMLVWILVVFISGTVSIGSITIFLSLGAFACFFSDYSVKSIIIILLISILGIYKHASNIKRIIEGNENKIGVKK